MKLTSTDTDSACTVIHRVLVDDGPFRTATDGLEMRNVDGFRDGSQWFLES